LWDVPRKALIIGTALLGLFGSCYLSNKNEIKRSQTFPLAFSERTDLRKQVEYQGKQFGEAVDYLTTVNDSCMKVAEAWNIAKENDFIISSSEEQLAKELEIKEMDGHTDKLTKLLKSIPKKADALAKKLKCYKDAANNLSRVERDLNKIWKEDHDDEYRTRIEMYPDSDGNMQTRVVTEYDYTDHTYWYNRSNGEIASKSLDSFVKKFDNKVGFNEKLPIVKRTHAEGEYAADKTIKHTDKKDKFTQKEYLKIANQWNFGSFIKSQIPSLDILLRDIEKGSDLWRVEYPNPKSKYAYQTCSPSDNGPEPYKLSKSIEKNCSDYNKTVVDMFSIINDTKVQSKKLLNSIEGFTKENLDNVKLTNSVTEKDILNSFVEMYKVNFPNSKINFDRRKRIGLILLWSFLGTMAGAGLGAGISEIRDRRKEFYS